MKRGPHLGRLDRAEPLANPARAHGGCEMRTLRLSLVGTVILVLLGGVGGAVLGQDEEADLMAPATVTGSVVYIGGRQYGEVSPVDGAVRQSGTIAAHAWEASDPRLSGTEAYTKTVDYYPLGFYVDATSRVLQNDTGRWVGTGVGMEGVFISDDMPLLSTATVILHGEDAYDGLTAYLLLDEGTYDGSATFAGVIFPGEMPPFPETAE